MRNELCSVHDSLQHFGRKPMKDHNVEIVLRNSSNNFKTLVLVWLSVKIDSFLEKAVKLRQPTNS